MNNKYKIIDNYAVIFCNSKRDNCVYEVVVDSDDIDKINKLGYSVYYNKTHFNKYYAIITVYLGIINKKPKYKGILLHKFVMNSSTNIIIDHKDGNTLNCRKNNLRITNRSKNCKNIACCFDITFLTGKEFNQILSA